MNPTQHFWANDLLSDQAQNQVYYLKTKCLVVCRLLSMVMVTVNRFIPLITELQEAMKSRFVSFGETDHLNWISFLKIGQQKIG